MSEWKEPKEDWQGGVDNIEDSDFNRIEGNINYLNDKIDSETENRENADDALQANINLKQPLPSTSTDENLKDYPVGTIIITYGTVAAELNSIHKVQAGSNYWFSWTDNVSSSNFLGTWICRGNVFTGPSSYGASLFQRVS